MLIESLGDLDPGWLRDTQRVGLLKVKLRINQGEGILRTRPESVPLRLLALKIGGGLTDILEPAHEPPNRLLVLEQAGVGCEAVDSVLQFTDPFPCVLHPFAVRSQA